MFTISQTALNSVLRDIREGNTDFVDQFFASRPEWQSTDEQASTQTDNEQSEEVQAKA